MSDAALTPLLLALPSLTPSLAIEVLPLGATLHRLFVQADGRTHDLVIGPEDPKGHLVQKYTNTIVGRYVNRVPVGTHSVSRDGVTSIASVQPNSALTPTVSLHGGPTGFDAAVFEPIPLETLAPSAGGPVTVASPPGALFSAAEINTIQTQLPQGAGALFRHVSPDGDQGYPGTLLVEVIVGLLPPQAPSASSGEYHLGSVLFIYRAKLVDGGNKVVTPINLTQHWGFNLDASLKEGRDTLSVKGHKLTIKSAHTVDIDSVGLPTGNLNPVSNTPHYHRQKAIGDNAPESGPLGSGYDHFYVFEEPAKGPASAHRIAVNKFTEGLDLVKPIVEDRPADGVVDLASSKSGLRLVFNSNQSGVQFYTNINGPPDAARKKIHGGSGVDGAGEGYGPFGSAFLEFHEPLASFLHPTTNPSGDDTLLGQDEIYNNYVRVDVLYSSPRE
ncbi:galactose mutarotase-like protein [Artomyces pyxidatus]|uniref:Galactose mutarotase-like protein n=1 Tax=Artomyces pyxidatus TaxID=48021 RepID=A0ACB8TFK1_9AGAM|nr:galactose mutarotase-like protein [Artomyces pyxidatus]